MNPHKLFIELFRKQLALSSAVLVTGTAQVLSKIKQPPTRLTGVHPTPLVKRSSGIEDEGKLGQS